MFARELEPGSGDARRTRRGRVLARYLVGMALGAVVLALLLARRGDFSGASHRLARLDLGWGVATVAFEMASLALYAWLQRVVLRASGATVGIVGLWAVTLANDAIALSVPGEPAFSSVFRYRQYRRRGASAPQAGWTILTLLIAQAVGLSSLLVVAVVLTFADRSAHVGAGVTVFALVVVVLALAVLVRRDVVVRGLTALVRIVRRRTGRPRGDLGARLEDVLARMRVMRTRPAFTGLVVVLAASVWLLDAACLACAFAAVREAVPWHGLLLAYGVAQIVAVLPIVPGGFGLVEGSLAVVLVAYGARRVPALSAVLVYRLVSFWLALAAGWPTFAILAWRERRDRRWSPAVTAIEDGARPLDARPESPHGD